MLIYRVKSDFSQKYILLKASIIPAFLLEFTYFYLFFFAF